MKYLWLKDIVTWNKLSLKDKVEMLRKHYCTGPSGQSSSVQTTRSETDKVLKEVIKILNQIEKNNNVS